MEAIEQQGASEQPDGPAQNRGESSEPEAGARASNQAAATSPIDPRSLPVGQRIGLLVRALNGAKRTNEALARCRDGEEMLDVLLNASSTLGLGLSRDQLANTPPIRDWVWWKNKEALLTIGANMPRYQQDGGQGLKTENGSEERKRFFGLF